MSDSKIILDLFKTLNKENIICAYHGDFSYQVVNGLLKDLKHNLKDPSFNKTSAKKTYNTLVECLENINKHSSDEQKDGKNEGLFVLSQDDTGFYINVGNLINNSDEQDLRIKLDQANNMTREELKERYREIIKNGSISNKGGAGLGIIDIAIKSGSKLNYEFHEYNEKLKFFTLDLHIKHN